MRSFTPGELSRFQTTQQSAMQDTCIIANPSTSDDSYNWPAETWDFANGTESICGYKPTTKEEGQTDSQVAMFDAELRLPLSRDSLIASTTRIKITKRFGVTLSTQPVYKVISGAGRGPSGLVVKLELVTDGS